MLSEEKCPNCGNKEFGIARDMKATRICKCGHKWLPPLNELKKLSQERDALRAENDQLKNNQVFEVSCTALFEENLRLKERIGKLIEAVLWASPCGQNGITPEEHPSYETIGKVMREALAQDQEAAK